MEAGGKPVKLSCGLLPPHFRGNPDCEVKTSWGTTGDPSRACVFSEESSFQFINATRTCSLSILQKKGNSFGIQEVRIKLLDQLARDCVKVEAEVVVARDYMAPAGVSCSLTGLSRNLVPLKAKSIDRHGDPLEANSVIYQSPQGVGVFGFCINWGRNILGGFCIVEVSHWYLNRGADAALYTAIIIDKRILSGLKINFRQYYTVSPAEIQFEIEAIREICTPNTRSNQVVQFPSGDDDDVKDTANEAIALPCGSYNNNGYQDMRGLLNSAGWTRGVGNSSIYNGCKIIFEQRRQ